MSLLSPLVNIVVFFSAIGEMVSYSSPAGSGVSDSTGIYESDLGEMQKKWAEYKDGDALDRYSK